MCVFVVCVKERECVYVCDEMSALGSYKMGRHNYYYY